MSIFGSQTPGPTRINQVQINQSVLGYGVAIVMGKGKVQQALLWADGFTDALVDTTASGKGFGGGKGNQYVYSADVIAALCNGGAGILGIGDVWSGQSWLSNTNGAETWTITAGTPYTPTQSASMTSDQGVGKATAYTATVNDAGSPGAVTLAGVHIVPFQRVAYGATLASGQYSVNPATNAYNFSPADNGTVVTVYYSFDLDSIKKQDIVLIPSGLSVSVGSSATGTAAIPFTADGGVIYYNSGGTSPLNGTALTAVSGTPTATGTYSVSGTEPATYHFASGDVGREVLITYHLNNTNAVPKGTSTTLNFSLVGGALLQAPLALLESNFPGADFGYSGIALVAYFPMNLGYGAQIQQNIFEVITADGWGGGVPDCNPVQCILQVLANKTWGLGGGTLPFPASAIDNGAGGTWGAGLATGTTRQDSTAASWFAANGFFISPVVDRQDTAASLMGRWLEAGQCAAFMSEGLLKLVPYGDTSTAGNGAVWLAPSSFVVALDDTCFLLKDEGEDPLKISSSPWQDAYNTVQVTWNNRENQYAPEVTPESDQAAINRYGQRIEDPQNWDFITTLPSATFAASMRVKRNVYTRNTYEFTLAFKYSYLEPMDLVYITASSLWAVNANNLNLNLASLPVRITKVVDNPDGTLDITAEDYPFGVHQPTLYNKTLANPAGQPNRYADPGNSQVVLFEATNRLTGYQGNQIWMGACGLNSDWGSCNVFASMDGSTYKKIGTIESPARIGALGAAFPTGTDPDTTHFLVIDLAENSLPLESGTHTDADQNNTLCFVDGELLSYSVCALTGQDQYTATGYIRRGVLGSVVGAHASGSLFMRLDDSILKYTYDPSWKGKTVYLKFQSVNAYGNATQDPSTLTATTFVVPGLNPGTVDASSGLIIGLTSTSIPPNVPYNTGNNAVLSTSWNTTTGTATVTGNGPGGAGTAWDFLMGQGAVAYPAFSITGLPASTVYAIVYNVQTGLYSTQTAYTATLSDFAIVLGTVTTASATTAGTSGGGGSTSGGSGSPTRGGGGVGVQDPA